MIPNEKQIPDAPITHDDQKVPEKDQLIEQKRSTYWTEAGWHRPLGGFWYNYVLLLIIVIPGLFISSFILPKLLPYPEILGYGNIVMEFLHPIYLFADLGIAEAVHRYAAQYSETNPRKAIRYISFFIWFQVLTGLLQITFISIYAIYVIPQTNMAYAGWFYLSYIMVQWPGTSRTYSIALDTFQQFDKENVIFVIKTVAIETLTRIVCILIGIWYGQNHPTFGVLMGSVLGFIIGSYLDDAIAMLVGILLFRSTIKPIGISLTELLIPKWSKEIIKDTVIYGLKVFPSGLFFVGVSALNALMRIEWMNNYPTWIGLYYVAAALVDVFTLAPSSGSALSQAYNNGKKELALYYIRSRFQWWGIISIGIFSVPVLILIPGLVGIVAMEYIDIRWMILPLAFCAYVLFPSLFGGEICQSCDLPGQATIMNFIEQSFRLVANFIIFVPWGIRSWFGEMAVIYFWLFSESIGYTAKMFYAWWIIKRKLFPGRKIKIPIYQTFIAPFIAIIPLIFIALLFIFLFNQVYLVNEWIGYATIIILILTALYLFPSLIFMPLYGLLGAWDTNTLDDFYKAALLSGPSKFLVKKLFFITQWTYNHSPWKGKFIIPYTDAMKEAQEITNNRKQFEQIK